MYYAYLVESVPVIANDSRQHTQHGDQPNTIASYQRHVKYQPRQQSWQGTKWRFLLRDFGEALKELLFDGRSPPVVDPHEHHGQLDVRRVHTTHFLRTRHNHMGEQTQTAA